MCLAVAIYIIGYGLELHSKNVEQIKFFLKLEYFGAPFMTAFWLILSYKFHFKKAPSMKTTIAILAIPFMTLFLSVTNELHHLIYANISVFESAGGLFPILSRGPFYYVNVAYAYSVQLFGAVVFFSAWRKSGYNHKTLAFWLFLGSMWPGLVNIIYLTGMSPLSLDLTPFGLSLSAVFFYVALFRYDFLELKEIVKDVTFWEINEGIMVIDEKHRLIDFNKAGKKIFDWLDLKHIGTDISAFREGKEILKQKGNLFEMKILQKSRQKYFEFRKTVMKENNKNVGCVYFIQDISHQKEMIQALNNMANYDSLTQIFNRRKLLLEAEAEFQRFKRYGHYISILMIDIDYFKAINDKYGHLAGDEVLKALAKACKERIRCTDILGRYGGEEFLIVLPETDRKNASKVADDIRKFIEEMGIVFNDQVIRVAVNI
jgi:diguanylate cyclase (GGDEF)-like protein